MADPFVAEIRIVPFNFAPRGWAFCNGQLLPISQNTALFSLLGTTYGGNGKSNFALPDLQGRSPMHPGQGPGLSLHDLGETGGSETVTLLQSEIPSHSHTLNYVGIDGNNPDPVGNVLGASESTDAFRKTNDTTLSPQELSITGGDNPHNNLQPYLTLNFIIAMQGVFPPRG
ncbi:phage tail protein [Herpetosiphon giganteus]|uniref:phage tail protein n=1 Tax=Herpetosiphon giganteus TaxID=2029754 RepID=UPI00195ED2C8|nr:tail fiber protein [Herpetosiphon giganteus]MBM7845053.1 microcystin-dependent protein [Herpetosiphon giganteus]